MIQKTNNYEIFSFLQNNRGIAKTRLQSMVKSINENGYFMSRPIIVTPSMQIIDGQSRFLALKQLNMEIPYCIETANPTKLMFTLNEIQSQWQFIDYIKAHAIAGSKFYKKVLEISEIKSLQASNALIIVAGTKIKGNIVKKGVELPINTEYDKIVNYLIQCSQYLPYWKNNTFVFAIVNLFKKTNEAQRKLILKKIPSLPQQITITDYMFVFENILNKYKKQDSLKIKL
jgi:hypothetical protein